MLQIKASGMYHFFRFWKTNSSSLLLCVPPFPPPKKKKEPNKNKDKTGVWRNVKLAVSVNLTSEEHLTKSSVSNKWAVKPGLRFQEQQDRKNLLHLLYSFLHDCALKSRLYSK